jgi:predicted ATP-dependent endonuclease of OLD family
LNSKIHSGNSFNNISYITDVDNSSNVVNLNDIKVMGNIEEEKLNGETKIEAEKRKRKELKFLKKHIKYKVSELFFSDAVIFVEGITEEILLSYHIDEDENLNKYYISIFNIDDLDQLKRDLENA